MPSRGLVLAREPRRPPSPEPPTGSSRTRFQTPTTSPPTWPRDVLHSPFVSFCLSAWSSPPFAAPGPTKSNLIPNLRRLHPGWFYGTCILRPADAVAGCVVCISPEVSRLTQRRPLGRHPVFDSLHSAF